MSFRNRILPVFLVTVVWSIVWYLVESGNQNRLAAGLLPTASPGLRAGTESRAPVSSGHPPYLSVAARTGWRLWEQQPSSPAHADRPRASKRHSRHRPKPPGGTLFECTRAKPWCSASRTAPTSPPIELPAPSCRWTEEEIKTLGRALMVPPPEVDLPALLAHRAATGAVEGEIHLRRKDGSLVDGRGIVKPDHPGRRADLQVITVFREIAHRKTRTRGDARASPPLADRHRSVGRRSLGLESRHPGGLLFRHVEADAGIWPRRHFRPRRRMENPDSP
jgi:hypothetical protein